MPDDIKQLMHKAHEALLNYQQAFNRYDQQGAEATVSDIENILVLSDVSSEALEALNQALEIEQSETVHDTCAKMLSDDLHTARVLNEKILARINALH